MERGEVIKIIRSLLVSEKGKVDLRKLSKDYSILVGGSIPYSKFGYRRLDEFLQSDSEFIVIHDASGQTYVDAKPSEKSSHIAELVQRQKSSKRGPRKSPRFPDYRERRSYVSQRLNKSSYNQNNGRPSSWGAPQQRPGRADSRTQQYEAHQAESRSQRKPAPVSHGSNGQLTSRGSSLRNSGNRLVNQNRVVLDLERVDWGSESCGNPAPGPDFSTPIQAASPVDKTVTFANDTSFRGEEFIPTGDPVADLKAFVEFHNIGELEVSSKVTKMKRNHLYTCRMKVGKHSYTSYPNECKDAASAEKLCAEEALKDLLQKYDKKKSLLIATNENILQRIPPMVEKHQHGVWVWQLELDYTDKYNERLPPDFLKIIDSSTCIQVERCLDNYVLRFCQPGDVLQKLEKREHPGLPPSVSVPADTVKFGEDGRLYAMVTSAASAGEIWCCQCSTPESEAYDRMVADMEAYYNANAPLLRAESVVEAGFYVVNQDGAWLRVRALTVTSDEAYCFLIDFGDAIVVPKSDICELRREFAMPVQAFVCRLAGLEDLYEWSANSDTVRGLQYKQVVLEKAADQAAGDAKSVTIPVYMYELESGQCVNEDMMIESASLVIRKGTVSEVFVSHVEQDGEVYVQCHSHGFEALRTLLADLEERMCSSPPTELATPLARSSSEGKLLYARYKVDGRWHRARAVDWSPNGQLAQLQFVDYGNTSIVNVKEEVVYPLEDLNDLLNRFPDQAVKVRIAVDDVPPDFVELAKKTMPRNQPVLLKVLDYDEEGVAKVEFFKRNTDGGLFCVNKSIAMEAELRKGESKEGNGDSKGPKKRSPIGSPGRENFPSGGTLPRPPLPNKGEYFEVHVPFAVNPYNFFVQPLASRGELYSMMRSLQERYQDVTYSPLQIEQVVPGNIYASKHDDDNWYRTSVMKVIHSGSISVFYCDFGYYGNLTVQQLVPLDAEFTRLPYQSLKAKLSGVRPRQSNWTMADCDSFKSLTEKKNFYCVILDIEKDELYEWDTVLNLILIDTSSDDDVVLGDELVKRGVAVDAPCE